jgi:tetratricopeptide (TPR) repeat protein
MAVGRTNDSYRESELYLSADTNSPQAHLRLGWYYLMTRSYDLAIQEENRAIALEPGYAQAYRHLSQAYLLKGAFGDGINALIKALDLSGGANLQYRALLGHAHALAGHKHEAEKTLKQLLALKNQKQMFVDPYYLGLICLELNDPKEAIRWLKRAWKEQRADDLSVVYLKMDPMLDKLRSNPDFVALLREMGLVN